MSLLIAYGTRPEYIKVKPVIDLMGSACCVLFTGQHEDLEDNKYNHAITINDGLNRLDAIIGSIMSQIATIFVAEPWISHVMVQGDTTSALAVALSAFNHGLKVIHLEAGLRTWDLDNPFPEEGNRAMISQIAKLHLCPTPMNANNVLNETGQKYVVGNTVLDSLKEYKSLCEYTDVVLVTMHRRENHAIMDKWFDEIDRLACEHPDINFIFPVHLNPNVGRHVHLLDHVMAIDPLPRDELIKILVKTRLVITDSGGIQEECSYFNKVCLVCRSVTERPETIGLNSFLVQSPDKLNDMFNEHINNYDVSFDCPYGDGDSAEKVYKILMEELDDYSADS